MVYKVYISTSADAACETYVNAVKAALWRIDEIPVTAITSAEAGRSSRQALENARSLIEEAHLFIGIYAAEYGRPVPGETRSLAELEYEYAVQRGKMCLIFVPHGSQPAADEAMQDFHRRLATAHIVHSFRDAVELQSQVTLEIARYRRNHPLDRLQPPSVRSFRGESAPSPGPVPAAPPSPAEAEEAKADGAPDVDLAATVERALALAEDDIETIVRRALQLHDARRQQQYRTEDGWLHVNPIFGHPLQGEQFQADIFMIMPFRPEYDSIYQNVVQPVTTELNLTMKRGDDFSSAAGSIIREVWAALHACRLVIAETTEINANVYYELGIAHTLGKPAVLLNQNTDADAIPFDIRHLRHIVYENTIPGGRKLAQDLRRTIIWLLNDLGDDTNGQAVDPGQAG